MTADATGCRRAVAERVAAGGGDHVLGLEENQPRVSGLACPAPHAKVKAMPDEAARPGFAGVSHGRFGSADDGHGRPGTRRAWVADEAHRARGRLGGPWPRRGSAAVVESVRQDPGGPAGTATVGRRHFASSRAGTDARATAAAVRGHRVVENNLHGQPGGSFREGECRIRVGHGAEDFSRRRRMALNLLARDRSVKVGVRGKRLKAACDEHCLLRPLTR